MVKKAIKAEAKNPVSKITKSSAVKIKASLSTIRTRAPRIVGMLNRKANLDESLMFRPTSKAPVIAIPDLEAPGKIAKACRQPMARAAPRVKPNRLLF